MTSKELAKDEKAEMKCACSKGGSTLAMVDAMQSDASPEQAKERLTWCNENPGTCTPEEVAAMEALLKHSAAMKEVAGAQLAELEKLKESCNALISSNAPSFKIKKCLAAVSSLAKALAKHVDTDTNSGSQCTNKMSPEKRYKLLVAEERLHNATVRLKREQDDRYRLVSESVAKKFAAANSQYKTAVTQADMDKAAKQLENAQNAVKSAQAYYSVLQENFAGFIQEKEAEVRSTLA